MKEYNTIDLKRFVVHIFASLCRALVQNNSKIYVVTKNKEDIRPTVYFKNGSYIKTVALNSAEDNCRGKRANATIEWGDCNTLSKEEIDEVLNNLKV